MTETRSEPAGTELEIGCSSCGATIAVPPEHRTAACPYCDSPAVVERPPSADRPRPAFVVPFVVDERRASEAVRRWVRSHGGPFAPSGFRRAAVRRTRAVYVPAWLHGAVAQSDFEAQVGETYETTRVTRDGIERETKTEWWTLRGRRSAWVRDVLVTASRGLDNGELEAIEPFDLGAMRRYDPAFLSGWLAEEASLSREESLELARAECRDAAERALQGFLPGDRQRGLRHSTELQDEVLDLVLLPAWVFAVRWSERKPPARVLVNGQTGALHGDVPISWPRVLLAIALGLGAVAGIALAIAAIAGAA